MILQQRDDLERLRTRVVALASVATVATGLLGGFFSGTKPDRNGWFYVGLVAVVALVGLRLLHPCAARNDI